MFYIDTEGKHRLADDIVIPRDSASVEESDSVEYSADLRHEWATPDHPGVRRVEA